MQISRRRCADVHGLLSPREAKVLTCGDARSDSPLESVILTGFSGNPIRLNDHPTMSDLSCHLISRLNAISLKCFFSGHFSLGVSCLSSSLALGWIGEARFGGGYSLSLIPPSFRPRGLCGLWRRSGHAQRNGFASLAR